MKEINKLSKKYLSELKRKSFTELSQLEDYQEEKIVEDKNSCSMIILKDTINDSELRIVIEIYCHWILGIGNMYADGFRKNSEGKISNLTEEELYDFI
jgi:hypothetical protein